MPAPEVGYARAADGAYIAYRTMGEGPIDLAWQFDWFGNVDIFPETDPWTRAFAGLASFVRVILHDRRSIGLSSRNVPVPNLETRVADLVAVLEAVDAPRPVLAGEREGGAANVMLATTDPERVRSLIWLEPTPRSTWSSDYRWGASPEYVEADAALNELWGTAAYGEAFIAAEAAAGHDIPAAYAAAITRLSRHTATPDIAREMARVWNETDIRPLLPTVRVPSLLLTYEDSADGPENLAYVAGLMPEAMSLVLPGSEASGDYGGVIEAIGDFLGVDRAVDMDTVVTTVLFTDIVDSTARGSAMGDRAWREVREQHDAVVRSSLERFRGREIKTMGDGFLATFDGPARGVRCAEAIIKGVRQIGIEIRAGLHTGEVTLEAEDISGLAVAIGARVGAKAGASEVLVSQTVKDLVAGSGLVFEDRGEQDLKGIPDRWRLYQLVSGQA